MSIAALWMAATGWLAADTFTVPSLTPIICVGCGIPSLLHAERHRSLFPTWRGTMLMATGDVVSHSIRGWHPSDLLAVALATLTAGGCVSIGRRLFAAARPAINRA